MSKEEKIGLKFILGGIEYVEEVQPHATLRSAIEKVFNRAKETGRRDLNEWAFKTEAGIDLDPNSSIVTLGLKNDEKIFMSLKAGAGG